MSVSNAKVVKTEPLETKDAKWLKLNLIHYTDPTGKQRTYESCIRRTRPSTSTVDSVGIVAIKHRPRIQPTSSSSSYPLSPSTTTTEPGAAPSTIPHILLQRQFRPALGKTCIETPAGLIDSGETPEQAALRELREETGYTGKLMEGFGVTQTLFSDPGITNTNTVMVHVIVDDSAKGSGDGNGWNGWSSEMDGMQREEGEYMECFWCPLQELWERCWEWEAEGLAIDARVGGIAEGVEMARRLGLGMDGGVSGGDGSGGVP